MISELTVGVVFRNESHSLQRCLESLKHISNHVSGFEVLLVDNHSDDDSYRIAQDWLQASGFKGQVIRRETNHMGEARNDVVGNATYRFLYFTDADCEVLPDTWPQLIKDLHTDPNAAAWGGSVIFPPNNSAQKALTEMQKSFLGHFGSNQMKSGLTSVRTNHLSSTHVLYDLEKIRLLGGFDSRLAEAAEDLDLSLRIRASGMQMIFVPTSRIRHYQVTDFTDWWRKAFRNGIWQTRLMAYNTEILKTPRPWPAIAFFFLIPFFAPVFIVYLAILAGTIFSNPGKLEDQLRLMGVYMATHGLYLIGEIYGLFLAIKDRIEPKTTKH